MPTRILFAILFLLSGCGDGYISVSEKATFSLKSDVKTFPAKLTATITQNDDRYRAEGGTVTFSADKPELVAFSSTTATTDGSGSASTVVVMKPNAVIPASGATVIITAQLRGLLQSQPFTLAGSVVTGNTPANTTGTTNSTLQSY